MPLVPPPSSHCQFDLPVRLSVTQSAIRGPLLSLPGIYLKECLTARAQLPPHFCTPTRSSPSCILFGGIITQDRDLGVFPQLHPPHPVMKSHAGFYHLCVSDVPFKETCFCCPNSNSLHLLLMAIFSLPRALFPYIFLPMEQPEKPSVFKTRSI